MGNGAASALRAAKTAACGITNHEQQAKAQIKVQAMPILWATRKDAAYSGQGLDRDVCGPNICDFTCLQ